MSSQETIRQILDSAVALFNEHSTGRISANAIAANCGISKGHLYYYFKNKQQIIREIYKEILAEIEANWYGDELQPTVTHMAEMFARDLDLIWRYRFFYREMVTLALADPELHERIQLNRKRRIDSTVKFFSALVDAGVLRRMRSREALYQLVLVTWVFVENWLNFMDLEGDESELVELGYDCIIEIVYPHMTARAKREVHSSYAVVHRCLRR